jgi:hypothetical protein
MATRRQRSGAYLMIAMAVGQAAFALAMAWTASTSSLSNGEDYHSKVEVPLYFAVLPFAIALGLGAHLYFARHVDRGCPWVSLGWLLLGLNILALIVFTQSTM